MADITFASIIYVLDLVYLIPDELIIEVYNKYTRSEIKDVCISFFPEWLKFVTQPLSIYFVLTRGRPWAYISHFMIHSMNYIMY